jgi:hypothetical protein
MRIVMITLFVIFVVSWVVLLYVQFKAVVTKNGEFGVFSLLLSALIMTQVISVIPSVLQIRKRLASNYNSSKSYSSEINRLNRCVYFGWFLFILWNILFQPLILFIICFFTETVTAGIVLYLVNMPQTMLSSAMLSLSLVFTLTDIRVSQALVDELIQCVSAKTISYSQFTTVRTEILRRLRLTQITNALTTGVAALNSIVLIIFLFTFYFELLVILTLKEIFFLASLFWEASGVNEASDRMTVLLGDESWDVECGKDLERLRIFTSSFVKPITFSSITGI